jgi:AraC-like DNA-binding protein
MREVAEGLDAPPGPDTNLGPGALVTDLNGQLTDSTLRTVRLLETPKAIPILYPAIMREICYWLLTGPHGGEVMRMTLANSHAQRVVTAIHTLRDRFAEPIRIDELASIARMSPSAFHRQFKAITDMTPLQYQKQLRLLEARRLIVTDAANQSGGTDAFHWIRSLPPRKDSNSMTHSSGGVAGGVISSTNAGLLALRRTMGTPPIRFFSPM